MDVFGSREGDPLLQDDPFVPSDEKTEDASDSSSQSTDATEQAAATDPPSPSGQREVGDNTVFDPASTTSSAAEEEEESTRVVVRSAAAAAEGRLTELNAAFDQGWRLAQVDLRSEEGSNSSSPEGLSFAFVLRNGRRAE